MKKARATGMFWKLDFAYVYEVFVQMATEMETVRNPWFLIDF